MTEPKPINLLLVCDNHYAILLATLIKSIEDNHLTEEKLHIYIVEDNISSSNKKLLEKMVNEDIVSLFWIPMKTAIPKGMQLPVVNNSYPINIVMRLFAPHFLPKNIDRAIYLDVDMVMLNDISKLYNVSLDGNTIGAVRDPITYILKNAISNCEELGLDLEEKYLNSGLIIYDLKKWRELNITEKIVECITKNRKYARLIDQYGLNVVLYKQWKTIDNRWNVFSDQKITDPYLIHYAQRKPIYKTYKNLYLTEFEKYLSMTPWRGTPRIGESRRYVKKMGNVFQKVKLIFQ